MSDHPFLSERFHIRWSELTPAHIEADITEALARTEQALDQLAGTDRGVMDFDEIFIGFEKATELLSNAWGAVSHLEHVCDSPELREASNKMLPAVTEFWTRLYLNDGLWDLFKTYSNAAEAAKVEGIRLRFMEETLEDFRESGADLAEEGKAKLASLAGELAELTKKFGENVLDSTNGWELVIEDKERLAGLPETAIEAAAASAASKDQKGYRFTLHAPSYAPVLEHLDDDEIRHQIWEGLGTIGCGGEFDNTDLIWDILRLRQEKASLLGKDNFADLVLQRRMAKKGARAVEFTEDLHRRVKSSFDREQTQMQEYRAEKSGELAKPLEPWEVAYWAEKRRQELFDFDDEELRPYFPIDGVIGGMFEIAEKIYGIRIVEREAVYYPKGESGDSSEAPEEEGAVEVWHPEVKFYEIRTPDGVHLGSFYADWHPREEKRSGAWMNALRTGRPPFGEDDREPHLGLICGNMTAPVGDKQALLKHDEVVTVFHEFGHLLHHLLGEVVVKSLNGTNVAWDFVELPSQFMENFCWEREALDLFARHHESGEVIPAKLFKRMMAARNYLSASATMRQLGLGKLDLDLHTIHAEAGKAADLDSIAREILIGYEAPLATRGPCMARRFSHLFSSPTGYAAGYYSYKWAEVLDADAFTRFQSEGVLSEKVGREFREKILSRGNSEDPDVLFREFMGRDPDLNSLLIREGLAS